MNTLNLKDIEARATENSAKYQPVINRVTSQIRNQNLKRGRVRPKDPVEAKIPERLRQKKN